MTKQFYVLLETHFQLWKASIQLPKSYPYHRKYESYARGTEFGVSGFALFSFCLFFILNCFGELHLWALYLHCFSSFIFCLQLCISPLYLSFPQIHDFLSVVMIFTHVLQILLYILCCSCIDVFRDDLGLNNLSRCSFLKKTDILFLTTDSDNIPSFTIMRNFPHPRWHVSCPVLMQTIIILVLRCCECGFLRW